MAGGVEIGEHDKVLLLSVDAHPGCSLEQLTERLGHAKSVVADKLDTCIKDGLVACLYGTAFDDPDEPRVYNNIRLTESGKASTRGVMRDMG